MASFQLKALTGALVVGMGLSGCALMGSSEPDLKLYVFDCGDIESRDVSMFSPGFDQGKKKQLVDRCYLIDHPKGKMLWDTGLYDQLPEGGIEVWDGAFHLSVKTTLQSQLDTIGIKPADIDYLGISHFHGDHTGNANLFADARLIIQQEEFDAAFGPTPDKFGFQPDSYQQLKPENAVKLTGDHDVFGDGRVVVKRAIGHTPGHQVLFVDLPDTGPLVLSGDLYHFTKNREFKRVPAFNFSQPQTLAAMDEIETFIKEQKATLWIQHDKEQNESIALAPAYHQ